MQQSVAPLTPPAAPIARIDMSALVSRQAELSTSISRMRLDQRRLVREIQMAGGKPSTAAQQELVQLDLAIANAQAELSASRAQIESSVSGSFTETAMPVRFEALSAGPPFMFMLVIGIFFAILGAFALRTWRRSRGVPSPAETSDVLSARLDRVDQSLDAIAIEVERIAESQRFVAKTLAEFAAGRGKQL
jgi:hypothetical protein